VISRSNVVCLGEVLWDVFPDGAHFGGAPANFACCAAELGGSAICASVVSGVGRDDLGMRAIDLLRARGVDTSLVSQVDKPTGKVLVKLDSEGHASYKIAEDTAWDAIAWSDELRESAVRCDAVCFGTLAQRSEVSRQTIQAFLQATRSDCLRILDVNLRNPFWKDEVVLQSLELANVVKLNDAELAILAEMLDWKDECDELIEKLLQEFSLQLIAVTRGANGSVVASADGERSDLVGRPTTLVDTVGAGDAFAAALTIGILRGLPLGVINAWASRVAEFVCTQAGAAPQLPPQLRQP
jgi:fructokinase